MLNRALCSHHWHTTDSKTLIFLPSPPPRASFRSPPSGSKYQGGRNKTLLKVKVFHDEEALVLGHEKVWRGCFVWLLLLVEKDLTCTYALSLSLRAYAHFYYSLAIAEVSVFLSFSSFPVSALLFSSSFFSFFLCSVSFWHSCVLVMEVSVGLFFVVVLLLFFGTQYFSV